MSPALKNVEQVTSSDKKSGEFNIFSENYDPYHKVKGSNEKNKNDENNNNALKESNITNSSTKNMDD